ncbi:MAG: transglutaminase domain-containing protein [Nanoarchaeota archaeon]|nr:transglutaminase domain-containing protein [Nanoarchaeota archaeon]MBU1005278.1 transglutaminase domain-containing protein [Nanoarchaeota archaeon]MBU1947057.1 transglutaminase domain-containing protein [Nanoarchaeota archaeon]
MKKRILFFIFLLIIPVISAQDWIFNSKYIDTALNVDGKINLISTGSRYRVDYVITNLSFVPQDGFQEEVLYINTVPTANIENGYAIFRWDKPSEKELSFSVESNVRSYNKVMGVKNKIGFPLNELPDEVKGYTLPSKTVDSDNNEIIKKASELAAGEDDMYVVVFKLADWTKKNVKYDLSTLTESVNQKASWVLTNKEGVCDELTNLFIAMNRALGIPAKFISGVAYTNAKEFEEGFGPHGWAEVYFPGYGWVPFDVTYGEFGFIDAGHIKLKESVDGSDASTRFQWLGQAVEVKASQLEINAEVKSYGEKIEDDISIDLMAAKQNVGFGSYDLIEATVKNLNDYYAAVNLRISKSKEIEIIGDEEKNILLNPGEEKKADWIIKISDNLETGYLYTFPFVVSSSNNISSEVKLEVSEGGKMFNLESMRGILKENEEEKEYSGSVELNCMSEKTEIYEYESSAVECNIKNTGNVYLDGLNVCLADDCKAIELGINQEDNVGFEFKPLVAGAQEITVKAENEVVSKSSFVDITVYDNPALDISKVEHPAEVKYKDEYEISFVLSKKSKFSPYNVSIRVEPVNKEWELNQLSENRKFILKMYGSELNAGENNFKVLVEYKDKNGKVYESDKEFIIKLVDVNVFQRIVIFFRSAGNGIMGLFK